MNNETADRSAGTPDGGGHPRGGAGQQSPLQARAQFLKNRSWELVFHGNQPLTFGAGDHGRSYFLSSVNAFSPPDGIEVPLLYANAAGTAAVQFETEAGGKVVCFGFPFETISSEKARAEYLSDILDYFKSKPRPQTVAPRLALTH